MIDDNDKKNDVSMTLDKKMRVKFVVWLYVMVKWISRFLQENSILSKVSFVKVNALLQKKQTVKLIQTIESESC